MHAPTRLVGLLAAAAGLLGTVPAAQAAGPPQVADTWATAVAASAADLHAMVNPNGFLSSARIEYITLADLQANLGAAPPRDPFAGALKSPTGSALSLGAGTADVEIGRHVTGLMPNTAYRYRVSASNTEGSAIGPVRPFATQESTIGFALPDSRGWEMVSPVDKNGGEIQAAGGNFGGGVLQASADGNSVTYSSASSFAGGAGAPGASQYLSRWGPAGWSTENITLPTTAGAFGPSPDGVPYQLFSGDLARGLVLAPERCEAQPCPRAYALRQSAGGSLATSAAASDMTLAGTNSDLTQMVLESAGNLYRWSGAGLTAVNLKPGDLSPTPGATLAAQNGAVSSDGSRTYFNLEGNLYLRNGSQTLQVDESLGGGGTFEIATPEGSVAFFTKAGHLYRYAVGGTPTDLTPAGEVKGVLGTSPDGSYLYYLTPAGLFLRRGASTTKVAAGADTSDYPPATGASRVAANGNLAFLSSTPLTEADAGGFAQVYLYAPGTATLTCASCSPSGSRALGPSTIPGAVANGTLPSATRSFKPRVLSAAGNRLFFDSRDALSPTDTNSDWDVYQWEAAGVGSCRAAAGCVDLISSGRAAEGARFLDASIDGDSAFFLTDGSLVPGDPGVTDVYIARVGGGFPSPGMPIACLGDACQVVPGEPEDPRPGTDFYRGEANPPLSFPKAKKQKKHSKRKAKRKAAKKPGRGQKGGRR